MITALILMHFFGGGTPEVFARSDFKTVERSIEEPERAETVTQTMERINEILASTVEKRRQAFEQLSEVDLNVDSEEISYDELLDQLSEVRHEARQNYVEEIFVMREHMTRNEWNTAFANPEE